MAKQKQNTFFGGAAILAAGILVVKLIGMFYKIPLINIIGEQGTADFNNAYNIYAVLLTISTAGLPVAVSKLVSEANVLGRRNQVHKTFRLALLLFLSLGIASFLIMYFQAGWLAGLMNDDKAAAGIRVLSPAVVCVGCLAAIRGYTQGHRNMTPTSISQIIEAICKLIVGLALAYAMVQMGKSADIAAAGAIAGVTVGTVVALFYMVFAFLRGRRQERGRATDRPQRSSVILLNLLRIAIPITLSASMVGIVTVIDSALVQGRIQRVLLENPDSWKLYSDFMNFDDLKDCINRWQASLAPGMKDTMEQLNQQLAASKPDPHAQELSTALQKVSRTLYGNYAGALNIYNLPTSLMAAITASVIPAVSAALAEKKRRGAARITGSAMRITALLAFPMGVGLYVLGTPIMRLLFPSLNATLAGPLLSTLGLATVFVCMMLVCNSILQAYGYVNLPVIVMLLGGAVKIFTNYNVVVLPSIGIYGAPAGNILCFGLCLVLDLLLIARVIPNRPRYLMIFLKPLLASAVMGGAAWVVYRGVARVFTSAQIEGGETVFVLSKMGNAAAVFAAIAVAMVIYLILVILLRAISRDDLKLMPKGEKIARLLRL